MAISIPSIAPKNTIKVKSCEASFNFFSPILRAMIALPPVASIVPSPTIRLMTGVTMLIADKASVFTNRDTNIVSPMVYSPIKTIVNIVGNANFSKDLIVKSCAKGLSNILFISCFLPIFFL